MIEEFLQLYNDELSYLRKQGEAFSKAYPKTAGRLSLGQGVIEDPLVGRLLESFSFLTAHVRYRSKTEINRIIQSFLDIIYPGFFLPIPAFSTVQFSPKKQLETAYTISPNTELQVTGLDQVHCTFSTCYATTVWPIVVSNVIFKRHQAKRGERTIQSDIKSVLKITLSALKEGTILSTMAIKQLRFFINAESTTRFLIYDLIMQHTRAIILRGESGLEVTIPSHLLKQVGFGDDETVLPFPSHAFSGHRLLSEYFAYPEKFAYFTLDRLDEYLVDEMGCQVEIEFCLNQSNFDLEKSIEQKTFLLGCSPIINLFEQEGDPIKIDHSQSEYQVFSDAHRAMEDIEIYQVKRLEVNSSAHVGKVNCAPYFGHKHHHLTSTHQDQKQMLYWSVCRKPCWELGFNHIYGDEVFISLSGFSSPDADYQNELMMVSPRLLCSNRDRVSQLSSGDSALRFRFSKHDHELIESIHSVMSMKLPVYHANPKQRSENSFPDLISSLLVNHLGYDNDEKNLAILKDILTFYAMRISNAHAISEVESLIQQGILSVETKKVIERHPYGLKQGFCSGLEYILTINEDYFSENSAYLFGAVIREFLSMNCSMNSFIRLVLKSKQRGEIARFKPELGVRPIC